MLELSLIIAYAIPTAFVSYLAYKIALPSTQGVSRLSYYLQAFVPVWNLFLFVEFGWVLITTFINARKSS